LEAASTAELVSFHARVADVLEERDGDRAAALRNRTNPDVRLLDGDPMSRFVVLGAAGPVRRGPRLRREGRGRALAWLAAER
jgi:hypothetical protein